MKDYSEAIAAYFKREKEAIDALDVNALSDALGAIVKACEQGGTIYTMGNGGSAATASHFVCDFAKGVYQYTDNPYRMICLSDNTPMLTAIANDISYDDVFSFQLKEKLKEGDLLIAISGSGNSENVLRAVRYAKECNVETVALTGYDGGELKALAEYNMHVPLKDMQITEDLHMVFDHMMMSILRDESNK